jgi:hypothetical protein
MTWALVTTDLTSPPEQIIARYAARWSIEVTFFDLKNLLGVGEARNRVRKAVERTVPFGLFCHSILILWYAYTATTRPTPPNAAPPHPGAAPRPNPAPWTCSPNSAA